MPDKELTDLFVLLDRSGSMERIRDDVIGGINSLLAQQMNELGECRVSLALFDDEYELVHNRVPVENVPTWCPDGSAS